MKVNSSRGNLLVKESKLMQMENQREVLGRMVSSLLSLTLTMLSLQRMRKLESLLTFHGQEEAQMMVLASYWQVLRRRREKKKTQISTNLMRNQSKFASSPFDNILIS